MITATTAPLMFVEYNYIVPTPYSCRFLGVVRSRPQRHPSCLQNTTTLYRHLTAAGSWEWYDHGHDEPPPPPPSCLQNTATLYRHLIAACSWEWYDHGHDGTPHVCRIQLHCTDTLQLQVLGSGTFKATTAPLVFVEYNYNVPTPYSCSFLGVVRSRPRRNPSCLQNTSTLYRHLTAVGSWEWYDHGHGPPRVYRIQLHCTDTSQLQVLGSGTITATTAPLVFVEYNYIVPTPYSCRFLGVVRSRPRRPHLVFVEYNYIVPTPYSCRFLGVGRSRHDGTPHVCRIQLHCTDTLQLQVLGSGMITATAPLVFIEYNYIVPTPYSCRFWGVVRSRPRRHPAPLVFVEYNYIVPTPHSCRFLGVI